MSPSSSDHLIERAAHRLGDAALLSVPQPTAKVAETAKRDAVSPSDPAQALVQGRPGERVVGQIAMQRAGLIGLGCERDRLSEEFRVVQNHVLRKLRST